MQIRNGQDETNEELYIFSRRTLVLHEFYEFDRDIRAWIALSSNSNSLKFWAADSRQIYFKLFVKFEQN